MPSWLGEVAVFARVLSHTGILQAIQEQVRFARARFGHYDLIDFVAVLISYVLSGEPTLLAFYERLAPWADTVGPIAQRYPAFWLLSIKLVWKHFGRSFRRICLFANHFLPPAACLIEQVGSG